MKPEPDTDSLFVIGAGCGGTGTATLKAALEILFNKPCYDLTTLVRKHPDHVRKWIELDERLTDDRAEEGDSIDPQTVRDIFRGYSCAMDFPAISYYWQLLHIYPNAKIVITETDADSWLMSLREIQHIRRKLNDSSLKIPIELEQNGHSVSALLDCVCRRMFGSSVNYDDDDSVFQGLEQWIRAGRSKIPKDRLLVFDPESEWEPLCEFLQMDIPNVPFPFVHNSRDPFSDLVQIENDTNHVGWKLVPVATLVLAISALAAFLLYRRHARV